jgi:hypothetical protein
MTITRMKIIVTSLVALSFAASLAGGAEAATRKHKKRLYSSQYSESYAGAYGYGARANRSAGTSSPYYEHRLEALPFGSQRWWSVYEEQRGRK